MPETERNSSVSGPETSMEIYGDQKKRNHLKPAVRLAAKPADDINDEHVRLQAWMDSPTTALELCMRAVNALERNGIYNVRGLATTTRAELENIDNFGVHSIRQCIAALDERHIQHTLGPIK